MTGNGRVALGGGNSSCRSRARACNHQTAGRAGSPADAGADGGCAQLHQRLIEAPPTSLGRRHPRQQARPVAALRPVAITAASAGAFRFGGWQARQDAVTLPSRIGARCPKAMLRIARRVRANAGQRITRPSAWRGTLTAGGWRSRRPRHAGIEPERSNRGPLHSETAHQPAALGQRRDRRKAPINRA